MLLFFLVLSLGTGVGQQPTAPKTLPEVECTDEARRDKVKGTVTLFAVIDSEGKASNLKVVKSLRPDLDERALDAVKKWRFEPVKKDGRPVKVQVNIELDIDCTQ